jgi:hypothetical protein
MIACVLAQIGGENFTVEHQRSYLMSIGIPVT